MHVSKIAAMVGLLGLFTVGCGGGMTKDQKSLLGNLGSTAGALAKGDTKGAAKQLQKTDVNKSVKAVQQATDDKDKKDGKAADKTADKNPADKSAVKTADKSAVKNADKSAVKNGADANAADSRDPGATADQPADDANAGPVRPASTKKPTTKRK